jgi:uncharacterized UBP type Zn finger protein
MRGIVSRLTGKSSGCSHLGEIGDPAPRTTGCEECLATGGKWVHLRRCLSCGHVGCCEQSQGRHAFHHFEDTGHAVMQSHEPDETWRWCWVDKIEV